MLDSPSLDKVLGLVFSFASFSFEAALRGLQLLSSLTGGKPEVIVAAVMGLFIFMLMLVVLSGRRQRNEVFAAWPSQESGLTKVPEAPSHATLEKRIFQALSHVEQERLDLTDEPKEQLQEKFFEASSEPSHADVGPCRHEHLRLLWRAAYSQGMKLAGDFLSSSTTQLTALIDRAVSHVQTYASSRSTARTKSRSCSGCDWQRVAREGWTDAVVSCLGWYPWQCKHCLTCSYFRRRR